MERTHEKSDLLDLNIMVLGQAQWPIKPPTSNFTLPQDLRKAHERFEAFYANKHTGRKLTWIYQQSKGEVKVNYIPGKTYTFMVRIFDDD